MTESPTHTGTGPRQARTQPGGALSLPGGSPVESRLYVNNELLNVISVEAPNIVVGAMNGAHHRARCIPSHESLGAESLHRGAILTVNAMAPDLAVIERVTPGHRDGCQYKLLAFQIVSHCPVPPTTPTEA